jgi:hypothetical protein
MSEPLTGRSGEGQLTLCVAASHAKTLVGQEKELESMAKGLGFGESMQELLRKYNRDSCLLKTPHGLSVMGWIEFYKTLPRWGMMRDGAVLPLPQLVRHTKGSVALCWPTPASRGRKGTGGAVGLKGGSAAFKKLVSMVGRTQALRMSCGLLNPKWSEFYLMGFPMGWTDTLPLETHRFREWQRWHGNCFHDMDQVMYEEEDYARRL